jgi:hypothetical protein
MSRSSTFRKPGTLPEKFLHEIWAQQLFNTSHLESHEGLPVRILNPGRPNTDTGPDFLEAKILIGETVYIGDVEIHRDLDEWQSHLHHSDRRYNRVILHVVMHSGREHTETTAESGRSIPTLILVNFLIEPVRSVWQKSISAERSRRMYRIPCFSRNEDADAELIRRWVETLGRRRIELKVRSMQNRLLELASPDNHDLREPAARYGEIPYGGNPDELPPPLRPPGIDDLRRRDAWEQLFYEALAESLGYSKNQSPFRRLSSLATFPFLREQPVESIEAVLFGVSGLLEIDSADTYAQHLQEIFREHHASRRRERMNRTEWQFFRLRPQNFPTLRIAGLAILVWRMSDVPLLEWLLGSMRESDPADDALPKKIYDYFTVPADGYWKEHYTFGKKASTPIVHLVGKNRVDEILINVAIPFLFLYARIYKNVTLRSATEQLLDFVREPGKNTITGKIDEELVRGRVSLKGATAYQGKIQLYKFYCRDERCAECEIGKTVFKSKI